MKLSQKLGISLLGFPIASFIIFIIYFLIYLILGESAYIKEIFAISHIDILLREFLVLGVSIFISILSLIIFYDISSKNYRKKRSLFTIFISLVLLIFGFALIPIIASEIFLKDLELFSLTFFILWIMFVTIFSLIQVIKDFITVWIINKKIKSQNINIEKDIKDKLEQK